MISKEEAKYCASIISHFTKAGYTVKKIDKKNRPYMDLGVNIETSIAKQKNNFNLGTLVSDSVFDNRAVDIGIPQSHNFGNLVDKLVEKDVTQGFCNYDNVLVIDDPSCELHALELMKDGRTSDKVLLIGVNYLLGASPTELVNAAQLVTDKLRKNKSDKKRIQDALYREGIKFVNAQSQELVRLIDIRQRLSHFFYETIPDVRQQEKDFRSAEIIALQAMGLTEEEDSPWKKAINTAFSDVVPPNEPVSPFDQMTYMFLGAREKFFFGYLIGTEAMQKYGEEVRFRRQTGKDAPKHKLERLHYLRIPGIIFAMNGHETDDETKGIYWSLPVDNLNNRTKAEILDKAIKLYSPFSFGQHIYNKNGVHYPYECFLKDLEWVIAHLDDSKLNKGEVLTGQLIKKRTRVPISDGYDKYGIPEVVDHKRRMETRFRADDGNSYSIYQLSKLNTRSIHSGTPAKALLEKEDPHGFGWVHAAAPFYIEKAK